MNRRSCIGMLCSGCVVPTVTEKIKEEETGFAQEPPSCSHDVRIDAPLMDMETPSAIPWDIPEEFLRLLIIRTSEQEWNAVWRICTHGNCDVEWDVQEEVVVCPCHISIFSTDGLVLQGPAERDLKYFPICYDEGAQTFFVQVS